MSYSKSSSRLEDCREEKLLSTLCTVGSSSTAPTAPLPLGPGEYIEELPCSWCITTLHDTIQAVINLHINSWFNSVCRTAINYIFEVDGEMCNVMNGYISDMLEFGTKYVPLFLCKYWDSCSTQEAIAFASDGLKGDLPCPCEECNKTRNTILHEIARLLKNYEDDICFILKSLMGGSSTGCKILKLDSNNFNQVAENIFVKCPTCATLDTDLTDSTNIPTPATESTLENNLTNADQFTPKLIRNETTFLLNFVNLQNEKCLKFQKNSAKIQVADCKCFFCQPGDRDETTFDWFRHGTRIVSSSEGLVLEATEANEKVILAPYDQLQSKQEWHIQALDEPEGAFIIINGYHNSRLAMINPSFGRTLVDIGVSPETGNSYGHWEIKIKK